MNLEKEHDVIIAGGGLAGLCLALQIKKSVPEASVVVAERVTLPNPEAAHKVGESSVEAGSHYFENVLGLGDLLSNELRKFGLRFFMSDGDNTDIAARTECGPSHYLFYPSYQIDRGQFENALAVRAHEVGVEFIDGCCVDSFSLGQDHHTVTLSRSGKTWDLQCRWVVDATGRRSLLKKELSLEQPNRHHVNAAWFRVDQAIDPDHWASDSDWRNRLQDSRRMSTNHFMGEGYWVWLIPLAHNRTSVGIVADGKLHPFNEISSFPKAFAWLEKYEPQLAAVLSKHLNDRMDFCALKNYSHGVKKMYSDERWCLTGDAGAFIDPLYSPGSDFIGIANTFSCDLITRDLRGEPIKGVADRYDQSFRSLTRTCLATYHRQYSLMGHSRIMITKIMWDFVMYWGSIALLFNANKFCDEEFMEQANPLLQAFAYTNISMQGFFRKWARSSEDSKCPPGSFIDYAEHRFLADLNHELTLDHSDESLLAQLSRNLELARNLKQEILAEASRLTPGLKENEEPPTTDHLREMFNQMDTFSNPLEAASSTRRAAAH
ncbi:MAG: NAD(P)/FAD-dependent oxidoreductase [Myxococcota bacterium]|nr:NAD(P)/FAD-dependent oxidoreductase [Myxococcota bacterium]